MKRTFLIISLTFLTITGVKSQEKTQFGVKGGMNFTNMTTDFGINKSNKTGFHVGVMAEIPIGTKFSLQPEILYSTKGVQWEEFPYTTNNVEPTNSSLIHLEYNLDYILVPILVKVYLFESFSFDIGSSFNFLVNSKRSYSYSNYNSTKPDVGKDFEFCGLVGFSYKIKSTFITNVRYSRGFTNAIKSNYKDSKNYGFSIGIGYMF